MSTAPLPTIHPPLMVPHLMSFGVVVYTNGNAPVWNTDALRQAIIDLLPHGQGLGVGEVTCVLHGVYQGPQA